MARSTAQHVTGEIASQNEKGPAEAATSPSHGSNASTQESQNTMDNITTSACSATDRIRAIGDSTPSGSDVATPEWMAAQEFEPWTKDGVDEENLFTPPSNVEWTKIGEDNLPFVRIAFLTMFKTKEELVGMFGQEGGDELLKLIDDFEGVAETFAQIGKVEGLLRGAAARLYMAAGTYVAKVDAA